jgi:hypothetical protein
MTGCSAIQAVHCVRNPLHPLLCVSVVQKLKPPCPGLNIINMYDLDIYIYKLKCTERKYQAYVMKAAWSDEDCYEVDKLKAIMDDCIKRIEAIEQYEATNEE